jgi:ribosomal protein S18 acetylase RimI-like enzyme
VTQDDADALAEMWQELVAYHQSLSEDLPGAARGGEHRYTRRIVERLDDPYTRALVAEIDGQVVGFVLGMIVDLMPDIFAQEPAGFLADIYVEPAYRRLGAGRALVQALKDWFHERGIKSFDWHVATHNQAGLSFWRSVGGRDVMLRMRADVGENNHD